MDKIDITAAPSPGAPPATLFAFYRYFLREHQRVLAWLFVCGFGVACADALVSVFVGKVVAFVGQTAQLSTSSRDALATVSRRLGSQAHARILVFGTHSRDALMRKRVAQVRQTLIDSGMVARHIEVEGPTGSEHRGWRAASAISVQWRAPGQAQKTPAPIPAREGTAEPAVSMRPVPPRHLATAIRESSLLPAVHGSPVHCGDPSGLGIDDLGRPDFGDAVEAAPDDIPVFWACGVTPQAAVMASRPPFALTHAPGQMFLTDARDEQYRVA